jgi:glycosyltransferase involved in cell wall biosynthesis
VKITECVTILTGVTTSELRWLYQHADLYVCPSFFEGFALTPLEALQFGVPVVLSDLPVLHEVYGEGFRYFDPRDIVDLERAIDSVDDEYRTFCRESKLLEQYTWKKFAERNLELYRRIQATCTERGSRV